MADPLRPREIGFEMGLGFSQVVFLAPLHGLYFLWISATRLFWVHLGRLLWPSLVGFRRGFIGLEGGPFRLRVKTSTVLWTTIPPWAFP